MLAYRSFLRNGKITQNLRDFTVSFEVTAN